MSLPFKTDYAKSGRSKCHTTKKPITARTLRVATMVKSRNFDGMQPNWNDAEAFMTMKTRRKRPKSVDEIDGFDDLRPQDQERIEGWIKDYTTTGGRGGGNKEEEGEEEDETQKTAVRQQAALVWKIRDLTTGKGGGGGGNVKALAPATIKGILTENKIPVKGNSDLAKVLAEIIVFGVPPFGNASTGGCCGSRPLRFCPQTCRYVCKSPQAWGECPYSQSVSDTVCSKIQFPSTLKAAEETWLEAVRDVVDLQQQPQERLFVEKSATALKPLVSPATTTKKRPPTTTTTTTTRPKKIGKHKPKLSRACMDPECGLWEGSYHVLDEANGKGDPIEAFPTDLYDTTLCRTDITSGTNSQYKLQLVVPDNSSSSHAYVWRVWGRVGGKGGGGDKLERFNTIEEAKKNFCTLFQKQTGNEWENRKIFVKHPGKFFQLEISYVQDNDDNNNKNCGVVVKAGDPNSKLDMRVQEVVAAMFDEGIAVKQLKSLEVDLEKMPLGALTEAQLRNAYFCLSEIEDVLKDDDDNNNNNNMSDDMKKGKLQQLSNEFYSKCPVRHPVLIDSLKILKGQVEMVDELINLQASNAVMNDENSKPAANTVAPVDDAYNRLKTEFIPLDPNGQEYNMLKQYVANTRNASLPGGVYWGGGNDWGSRGLRLLDAFEIHRDGEKKRFQPSKSLGNRQLLWHGSRISNYTGILSQGLRIAPPEAPVSGYRFGKGVYFANMLGKSANYCRTDGSSEMFILACDVSLGKTFETASDMYMEKPQPGTNSTHALSEVIPNPSESLVMGDKDCTIHPISQSQRQGDEVVIPLGKPMPSSLKPTPSCDVSEFIVYDQAQVNIRFLLRLTTNPNTKAADGSVAAATSGSPSSFQRATNSVLQSRRTVTAKRPLSSPGGVVYVGGQQINLPPTAPNGSGDDDEEDSDDNSNTASAKKSKMSVSCFIKLDMEDQSRPSISGLKVLNSRTFVEGLRLTVCKGDITDSKTAAIVVPSDSDLSLNGMVGDKVKQIGGTAFVNEVNTVLDTVLLGPTASSSQTAASTQQSASTSSLLPSNITRLDTSVSGKTIRELATAANVPYLTPFYKVVRKEDVSATKDVICLEASSGTYHRGPAARNFLGVASNKKIKINPADIKPGVEVFVQSTSHNRKIPSNSSVLLETSVPSPIPPPPPPATRKTLSTSDACVVGGHGLPSSHVIFVVSPVYSNQGSNAEAALKLTVKNALMKSSALGLKSITLPSIGSGRAGYDKGQAAAWIIEAIAVYLEDAGVSTSNKKQSIEEVCFCLFDDESLGAYREGILAYEKRRV